MKSQNKNNMIVHTSGTNKPKFEIPEDSWDCHHHIYDPLNYPYIPEDKRNQPASLTTEYQKLKKRLGIANSVIVTPSAYGVDNSCTIDSLKRLNGLTKAIVVLNEKTTDKELYKMNKLGVRGVRFNISTGNTSSDSFILNIANRVVKYNWHICFLMSSKLIIQKKDFLKSLPCKIVFDHRSNIFSLEGEEMKAFNIISNLMKEGKAWVKISAPYLGSKCKNSSYTDTIAIGKAFVKVNAKQVLWGSDWPHPREYTNGNIMPNDADMLDLINSQITNENDKKLILVENPKKLYGF